MLYRVIICFTTVVPFAFLRKLRDNLQLDMVRIKRFLSMIT